MMNLFMPMFMAWFSSCLITSRGLVFLDFFFTQWITQKSEFVSASKTSFNILQNSNGLHQISFHLSMSEMPHTKDKDISAWNKIRHAISRDPFAGG